MARKRATGRKLRASRTYSVSQIAEMEGVCRNTVRYWHKAGLEPIDDKRPLLFAGSDVKIFLQQRRNAKRTKCPPGHFYCLACRTPRTPAEGLVDWEPDGVGCGSLTALCGTCSSMMHRFARAADVQHFCRGLDVKERVGSDD